MKISVIIAVLNAKETIAIALESLLAQTFNDIEIIVIDGGSTDGTAQILQEYKSQLSVSISEPDNGIYDALNKGIARATGDVIGFLHADDFYANEQVLIRIADEFNNPDVGAVYGDLVYVSQLNSNKVIRSWRSGEFSLRKLKAGWMPPHPTFYVRKSIYAQYGCFDASLQIAADYDCILRFLGGGIACAYIPEVLVKMRMGGESNRSLSNMLIKMKEDLIVIKRNNIGGVWTLMRKSLSKLPQFFRSDISRKG